jgi:hypothetical protein
MHKLISDIGLGGWIMLKLDLTFLNFITPETVKPIVNEVIKFTPSQQQAMN